MGQLFPYGRYGTPRRRRWEGRLADPAKSDTDISNPKASLRLNGGPDLRKLATRLGNGPAGTIAVYERAIWLRLLFGLAPKRVSIT